MYLISELARAVNLSRSTLLYYEKLGLIAGRRQANGYRYYSEHDLQQLRLLQQLQAGGLSLKACRACLAGEIDRQALTERLAALDEEIARRQQARELLSAMLGLSSMKDWHSAMDKEAPNAHLAWLIKQGFSEKQALRLKWLSQDMNQHDQYMADFTLLVDGLERLGPGSARDTLRALRVLPKLRGELLEIGCGRGATAALLAQRSGFAITALDNDADALACLTARLEEKRLSQHVSPVCASMFDMPFAAGRFDVIWSEGSAYIMGVQQALDSWRGFLKADGWLVISDLVWLTDAPDEAPLTFWREAYPQMDSAANRCRMMARAGYRVVKHFTLGDRAWANYLDPLAANAARLAARLGDAPALADIKKELALHRRYLGQYGYHMFVLQREDKK